MYMHDITCVAGANKKVRRVGRGKGSGRGKTCGRGSKGDRSRSGNSRRLMYEGGQMPLYRRLPKRGFSNVNFTLRYEVVNVSQLDRIFADGTEVGPVEMVGAGLLDNPNSRVKILGDGDLTKKLTVSAHKFSKSAEQKISGCGGTVKVVA
jgi:large subunit ribosomal protein L15